MVIASKTLCDNICHAAGINRKVKGDRNLSKLELMNVFSFINIQKNEIEKLTQKLQEVRNGSAASRRA